MPQKLTSIFVAIIQNLAIVVRKLTKNIVYAPLPPLFSQKGDSTLKKWHMCLKFKVGQKIKLARLEKDEPII